MNGIPLMRGEGSRDQATAQEMLTAVVLCGILIAIAAPAVKWITGFDTVKVSINGETRTYWTDNPSKVKNATSWDEVEEYAMPSGVTTIFDKLIMGIRAVAAFVMIIALVWGGIKLEARDPPKADAPAERQVRKPIPQSGEW